MTRKGYLLHIARITCYFDRLNIKFFRIKNFFIFFCFQIKHKSSKIWESTKIVFFNGIYFILVVSRAQGPSLLWKLIIGGLVLLCLVLIISLIVVSQRESKCEVPKPCNCTGLTGMTTTVATNQIS